MVLPAKKAKQHQCDTNTNILPFDVTVKEQEEELHYYRQKNEKKEVLAEQKKQWEALWSKKGKKRKRALTVEEKKRRALVRQRKKFQKDFFDLKTLVAPRIRDPKYAGDVYSPNYAEQIPPYYTL